VFDLIRLQNLVGSKIAQRSLYAARTQELGAKIEGLQHQAELYSQARFILAEVTRTTQERLKGYVEELVTMAIQSIYSEDLRFVVDFDYKRNKAEISFRVKEGEEGEPFIPKDEMGGGLVEIISFALRVVLWSLQNPSSRAVLILDEPFSAAGSLSRQCGEMVKEISMKLGLQIIMVTHSEALAEIADRAWKVERVNRRSVVTQIGGSEEVVAVKKRRRL